jgi:hypothetical protein
MMNSSNTGTASYMNRDEENTITPKLCNEVNSIVVSALRDDVISQFLADVDEELFLVKKQNTEVETTKMGSRKKVMGVYTRVLERYQQAFLLLKLHPVSYYKVREKKDKIAKVVSSEKENRLALVRAALTSTITGTSDSDRSSVNATAVGTGDNEIAVNNESTVRNCICHTGGCPVDDLR